MTPVVDALEHVAVAREEQRLAAGGDLELGERPEQVVGLEVADRRAVPAERAEERGRVAPLALELGRHRRAVGVVGGEGVGPVVGRLGAPAEHDRARLVALDDEEDEVRHPEQRVDRVAVVVGDALGQREERAVHERGGVDGEQRERARG